MPGDRRCFPLAGRLPLSHLRRHAAQHGQSRHLFQCSACRRQTSPIAGTIFASTKLPLRLWFRAMYHLTQSKQGVSSIELCRRLGVTQTTAWKIKHKLKQVMLERDAKKHLAGRVEIDDAYIGGERSGGKRGRGAAGKTPFVAAVETTSDGRLCTLCGEARRLRHALEAFCLDFGNVGVWWIVSINLLIPQSAANGADGIGECEPFSCTMRRHRDERLDRADRSPRV